MWKLLLIGAGGFVGAVLRYGLGGLVQRHLPGDFPAGTFAVNTLGCLALGIFMGACAAVGSVSDELRGLIAIGLLGAFTTFSTFGYEATELTRDGALTTALAYVAASLVAGLAGVWAGHALGLTLFDR